jgi:hypothetical protein
MKIYLERYCYKLKDVSSLQETVRIIQGCYYFEKFGDGDVFKVAITDNYTGRF